MKRLLLLAFGLSACASNAPVPYPTVMPSGETDAVASVDDAADDPAIWVHPTDSSKSLILGTDKKVGLHAYDLSGKEVQFLKLPDPNNVDLRQGISIGSLSGDFAVTSNRGNNTFSILRVTENGAEDLVQLPAVTPEPYGICMAGGAQPLVAITHKTGELDIYAIDYDGTFKADRIGTDHVPGVQMEGCVFDEANGVLYVGYEEVGIFRFDLGLIDRPVAPSTIDVMGSDTRLIADIEGLTIYKTGEKSGYLIASVQGDNSYQVYDRESGRPALRFRITNGPAADGAEETDGLDVSSAPLGAAYPKGLLVVQDGFNRGDQGRQNFKLVDWRKVEALMQKSELQ